MGPRRRNGRRRRRALYLRHPSPGVEHMADYPPIADHGLIGDLQTAALVTTDGAIDWFCCPRFDSPSVFASLLDQERGGSFRISPKGNEYTTRQLYYPDTAVLVTRFMAPGGVAEVIDFMPVAEDHTPSPRHRIMRVARAVRGEMEMVLECQPRFDYARQGHELELSDGGAVFRGRDLELTLHSAIAITRDGDGVRGSKVLKAGDAVAVMLESATDGGPRVIAPEEALGMFDDTARFWRDWIAKSTYSGRWREAVFRSAITLKLMTYAPTGALVAAPTTGLPEQVGGERNWDYRFTWVRDASFSVYALLGLGFVDEARAFLQWLAQRVSDRSRNGGSGPLKIMYRVDGSSDLDEEVLDHLDGYRGSKPVRIGNGAANQLQLDIYGEALYAIWLADGHKLEIGHHGWTELSAVIDWVCDNWDRPDEGIWETRGGRKDFVYGRLMSWVALDRGVRLAAEHGRPANVDRWRDERDHIYQQIMQRGWDARRQSFTQSYGNQVLDASTLLMPLVSFIAPSDPMWKSSLRAMDSELVSDSLVYRYDPSASPDGLAGAEGTFSICTFWYVDALARSGRLEESRLTFEKMLTYSNHVGLFSEEIGLTGEQLGNFPQAFTHLSLINAAINLDFQIDHGAGWVDPVMARKQ
jgi:GH15 family glucan-1,4-alpha-glucosidase